MKKVKWLCLLLSILAILAPIIPGAFTVIEQYSMKGEIGQPVGSQLSFMNVDMANKEIASEFSLVYIIILILFLVGLALFLQKNRGAVLFAGQVLLLIYLFMRKSDYTGPISGLNGTSGYVEITVLGWVFLIVSIFALVLCIVFMVKSRDEDSPKTNSVTKDAAKEPQNNSTADELKKFKDLLDSGAITQEEFDAKKKQLLGL